jgi:hypothetical protein
LYRAVTKPSTAIFGHRDASEACLGKANGPGGPLIRRLDARRLGTEPLAADDLAFLLGGRRLERRQERSLATRTLGPQLGDVFQVERRLRSEEHTSELQSLS